MSALLIIFWCKVLSLEFVGLSYWMHPWNDILCLVGGWTTHVKNSQIGSFTQIGMKMKHIWNHHPDVVWNPPKVKPNPLGALKFETRPSLHPNSWQPKSCKISSTKLVGSSWLKVCSLVCQGLSYPKLHDLDKLEDNHSIPKQWREEILHQLIGMKSHYVLGCSILQPSTIPDPKGVWGSRFRLRTLHTQDVWTSYRRYRKRIKTRIYPPVEWRSNGYIHPVCRCYNKRTWWIFNCYVLTAPNSSIELPKKAVRTTYEILVVFLQLSQWIDPGEFSFPTCNYMYWTISTHG